MCKKKMFARNWNSIDQPDSLIVDGYISHHFGSYKAGKLGGTQCKGLHSAVKSSQLSWTGQYTVHSDSSKLKQKVETVQ